MNFYRAPFLLICLSGLLGACSSTPELTTVPAITGIPETQTEQQVKLPTLAALSVIAVGDVMLGTDFPEDRLPPDQGRMLLQNVAETLRSADITFGNYEGTLISNGEPAKQCQDITRCYLFRTPPQYANQLVTAGFDVLSLANNHARDFGEEGRAATMQALDAVRIFHSGLEGDVASWPVKGRKIAVIAFAPFRGAHNPLVIEKAAALITGLADSHDIVLVSMHMGAEGEEATRIPFAEEFFHGEHRGDVVAFSRAVVDAGADLVIGHGPHVPRALELYKGRLIAYSLGNFCTYYGINVRGLNGLAPILKARLSAEGEFIDGRIISTRQYRPNGPLLDPSHQAAKLMAELTRLDFPDTLLEIGPSGQISIKNSK